MGVLQVGERFDGHLQPFTRSDETPREHDRPGPIRKRRTAQLRFRSMRNDTDRGRVDVIAVDQPISSRTAHYHRSLGQGGDPLQNRPLARAGPGEHGMKRDDRRDVEV